jgi:dihydroneopterin aldolase
VVARAEPTGDGDAVLLEGIRVPCALGVSAAERRMRRPVRIDLELSCPLERAGRSDRIGDTIDYGAVFDVVAEVAGEREHRLVEALGERVTAALFERFPRVTRIVVTVRKSSPLAGVVDRTGVRLVRRRPR